MRAIESIAGMDYLFNPLGSNSLCNMPILLIPVATPMEMIQVRKNMARAVIGVDEIPNMSNAFHKQLRMITWKQYISNDKFPIEIRNFCWAIFFLKL